MNHNCLYTGRWEYCQRLDNRSRMSREAHVRFCEGLRVKFPRPTRRVVLCRTRGEATKALEEARKILESLGLAIHPDKTRITHINEGFEFLGYKLKRGKGLKLARNKIKKKMHSSNIYAFPKEESIKRFKDTIKERTKRKIPLTTKEIIDRINPVIRGWGIYYRRAHIRKLFNKLQRWIVRRIWNHRYKRWSNYGWKYFSERRLYSEFKLVNLLSLIPDLRLKTVSM